MSDERLVYQGKIVEVVELPQPSGKVFEIARRAPGVRLIIPSVDSSKLLITREYRREADGYDYRLPGGKVFDTLPEYDEYRQSGRDMLAAAEAKAREEAREETGLDIRALKHFVTANCGATVTWDLYYFEVTDWTEAASGQQLEHGEDITTQWLSINEVRRILETGQMHEYRSAGVLVQWLAGRS